jgi:trk system potassium uptake protein TrkA
MRVVIAGCGRVGSQVARLLADTGADVSVIDHRPDAIGALGSTFDGAFHTGLAYDVDALEAAGIREADAFIAATSSDNANLMAAQVANKVFGVSRAIARLDDPARERSYRALGVDFVAGTHLVAQVISERIREPEFAHHVSFPSGDVQVLEMVVGPHASGVTVRVLERAGAVRVAAVRRDPEVLVARRDLTLEAGDIVVAAVQRGAEKDLREYLAAEEEQG